jgi:hypothetical protein
MAATGRAMTRITSLLRDLYAAQGECFPPADSVKTVERDIPRMSQSMRSGGAAKEIEAELLVQNAGKEINRIHFHTGGLLDRTSTNDRIIWQKRMKCKLRNQMTALCGEPDETPMGFN